MRAQWQQEKALIQQIRDIKAKLEKKHAASIYSVALLCHENQVKNMTVYAEKVKEIIRPPWRFG